MPGRLFVHGRLPRGAGLAVPFQPFGRAVCHHVLTPVGAVKPGNLGGQGLAFQGPGPADAGLLRLSAGLAMMCWLRCSHRRSAGRGRSLLAGTEGQMKVGKSPTPVVKHDAIVRRISVRRVRMNEIALNRGERRLDAAHQFH